MKKAKKIQNPKPSALSKRQTSEKKEQERIEKNLVSESKIVMPSTLTEGAKKEWRRIMKLFKGLPVNIISALDLTNLIVYCEAVAVYMIAQKTWAKMGTVVSLDEKTQKVINKTLVTMRVQGDIIRKLSTELCLSPLGRARMGVNPADKENIDPLDDLLIKFGG